MKPATPTRSENHEPDDSDRSRFAKWFERLPLGDLEEVRDFVEVSAWGLALGEEEDTLVSAKKAAVAMAQNPEETLEALAHYRDPQRPFYLN